MESSRRACPMDKALSLREDGHIKLDSASSCSSSRISIETLKISRMFFLVFLGFRCRYGRFTITCMILCNLELRLKKVKKEKKRKKKTPKLQQRKERVKRKN